MDLRINSSSSESGDGDGKSGSDEISRGGDRGASEKRIRFNGRCPDEKLVTDGWRNIPFGGRHKGIWSLEIDELRASVLDGGGVGRKVMAAPRREAMGRGRGDVGRMNDAAKRKRDAPTAEIQTEGEGVGRVIMSGERAKGGDEGGREDCKLRRVSSCSGDAVDIVVCLIGEDATRREIELGVAGPGSST